ncbi:MAG: DMT family transporter, partial [Streptomycetaceae bacterium]|nr:DMT family transporter [Streptomycetaceae bacterium]
MTVALALLTSVLWGFADFGAGLLTRRIPAARVVLLSQTAATLVLGVVVLCTGALSEASPRLWFAVAAGFVGPMALLCFYEALARGPMGVVSPLATAGVVIPVGIGLAVDGDRPGPMQYAGILIALAGIAMAGGPKLGGGAIQRGTLLLTVVAALGFGTVFALLAEASAGVLSLFLAQFVQRVINVAIGGTVLVVTEGKRARRATTGSRERPQARATSPAAACRPPEPGPVAAAEGRDATAPALPARSPS